MKKLMLMLVLLSGCNMPHDATRTESEASVRAWAATFMSDDPVIAYTMTGSICGANCAIEQYRVATLKHASGAITTLKCPTDSATCFLMPTVQPR